MRDINLSDNMTQMSLVMDKCRILLETAQSKIKDADRLSEDAKLLYSQLKFEDVWEEIKRIFFSDLSEENSHKNGNKASDIKAFFSRLEQIFIKNSSDIKNMKTFFNNPGLESFVKSAVLENSLYYKAIESAAKRGAKLFFKDILEVPG